MKTTLRLAALAALFASAALQPAVAATASSDLLGSYVKISAALAADDVAAAKKAAATLATEATAAKKSDLAAQATAVAKADSIAAARKQFVPLSNMVEPMAAGQKDYVVMYCPMAKADWVQKPGTTANPYYGKMMLTCGSPKDSK